MGILPADPAADPRYPRGDPVMGVYIAGALVLVGGAWALDWALGWAMDHLYGAKDPEKGYEKPRFSVTWAAQSCRPEPERERLKFRVESADKTSMKENEDVTLGECDKCVEPAPRCEHGLCSRCCGCDGAAEDMFGPDR